MTLLQSSILFATLAGAMIPLGAALALGEHIHPKWLAQELRHSVMAFGGGVLIAAIALVLVPQGIAYLHPAWSVGLFAAGGLFFFWLDRLVARHGGSAAQLIAMVSDFVPEAMALGAMFAGGDPAGPLLALLIGLQNLPEGFNAFRELTAPGAYRSATVLWSFLALALLGPLAAVLGHLYLADQPSLVGAVMLFSAGGILYLVFQDIAPEAHLNRRWAPSLGAVFGFTFGLLGHLVLG
jgi:ZIP family zinc transporter